MVDPSTRNSGMGVLYEKERRELALSRNHQSKCASELS